MKITSPDQGASRNPRLRRYLVFVKTAAHVLTLIVIGALATHAQTPSCAAGATTNFTFAPSALGESRTETINLAPCETIAVYESHNIQDGNRGTVIRVSFLNSSGQTILAQEFFGFNAANNQFPDYYEEPFPFTGVVDPNLLPATIKVEATYQVFFGSPPAGPPEYNFTITRTPRPGYNTGGYDFSSAPLISLPATYRGSLRDGRNVTPADRGQYFKIHLSGGQSIQASGTVTQNTQYGTNFEVDIYDANQQLVRGGWVFTGTYGVQDYTSQPFTNPNPTSADFYVRAWSYTHPTRDFSLNINQYVPRSSDDAENAGPTACQLNVGEPINVTNGNMYLQQADYQLPGIGESINVVRTYNSSSVRTGLFGKGWSSAYDESLQVLSGSSLRLYTPDGRATNFTGSGVFTPYEADFHGQITRNVDGSFTLTFKDGRVHQFNASGKLLSLRDRNANHTVLAYDGNGKLASITDPFGRMLNVSSNANGRITSISDTLGVIATYSYGSNSELLSVTYADGSAFLFAYTTANSRLVLASVSDVLGNVLESHTYDAQARALTSEKHGGVERVTLNYVSSAETDVTDALGHLTKYFFDKNKSRNVVTRVEGNCSCGNSQVQTWSYDNQLNVVSHTNALGQTATYTYDADGNQLSATGVLGTSSFTYNQFGEVLTATDALNGVTSNTYDTAGNLLSVKDALNNTTTFTYDSRGQLLTMTNTLGKITTLTWDTSGRLAQAKDALNNTTDFAYDARGRLTSTINALNFITGFSYDPVGRVNKITRPDTSFITLTYDLAGRRTRATDALNNSTSFAYDSAYRLTSQTDAMGRSVSYTYDLMSNLIATTDQLSRTTNLEYDEFNRPIKTIYPPAVSGGARLQARVEYDAAGNVTKRTDTAGRITTLAYDNANRVVTVTDPALQVTQYEYDARSNVTAVVDALGQRYAFDYDALSRLTTATRAGLQLSFSYDPIGNRTGRTDYNNMTTGYTYDALNRLTKITYPDASTVSYGYDKLSQLTSAANINGTVSFVYDSLGRTTSTTDVWGQVLNYIYDANDRRTRLSFGTTTNVTYTYDVLNRLTRITDSLNSVVNFVYDASSKLTSRTLPNNVVTTYTYDGLDRLTRLKDAKGNSVIADNNYQYNSAGDITQNIDQGGTHGYGYDAVDRLISATYTGTPNETYAYDGAGNRTSSHKSAAYSYQPFNRLVSTATASYLYDNNGNMISKSDAGGTTQFGWDFENRLVQVVTPSSGTVSYKYDAVGRRIQRTASGGVTTNFVYDGQDVVKDINSDGSTVEYLNGLGIDNKIRQKGANNNSTYYFSHDHLGSMTALTGTTGKLVERITYDGYGNSSGSTRTRYGFTGRERDALTGLLYYRARFYDPQLGRFVSEDPIGLAGGVNSFAYVGNNPQNRVDPSGLFDIDVHYYLTYYLALKTGCFSDSEARKIAEGAQHSDEGKDRKPGPGFKLGRGPRGLALVPNGRQIRANTDFHAFGSAAQNARRANQLYRDAVRSGDLFGLGTYMHFLQDEFSHVLFAGNPVTGQLDAGRAVDHTSFNPEWSMEMAHASWEKLKQFGKNRGCTCTGEMNDADWKTVRDFVDIGYDPKTDGGLFDLYSKGVSNEQLRRKIGILNVPWRSATGR